MLYALKNKVRDMTPSGALALYHRAMAGTAAVLCGLPTRRMLTIGVTGTKGKSTVSYLVAHVLEEAGYRVGMTTTAVFKVGPREWLNPTKMTMLGRFALERLLARMVSEECDAAVVESSAEGLFQWRHAGIAYDMAIFTNLTPENIHLYGSFEKYREVKCRLFRALRGDRRGRKMLRGKLVPKVAVANSDDKSAPYFLEFPADEKWTFGFGPEPKDAPWRKEGTRGGHVRVEEMRLSDNGTEFIVAGVGFETKLIGKTNVMNAAAAIAAGQALGIPLATIAKALAGVHGVPGRFERIDEGQDFTVIVDYAHEPESFKQLYESANVIPHRRIIHVFGGTGGGRDKSRRPVMGTIAGTNADVVIVTMDDPYDEDPAAIAGHVIEGARAAGKTLGKDLLDIPDRKEAIRAAVRMARKGDLVLITGKGSEQKMMLAHGRKIAWDDREAARIAIHVQGQKVELYGRD